MTLRAIPVLALVVVSLVAASCGAAQPAAATVNGSEITDEELAHEVDVFSFLAGLNRSPCGTAEEGETQRSACARFTLGNLILQRVVAAYATRKGIEVAPARVTQTVGNLDDQVGKQQVDRQLREHGLTREDLLDLASRVLLFQDVQAAVAEEQLTEEALRSRYDENILSYTIVQVDHILVRSEAEARDVYRQVTGPGATEQDFRDLARDVSIDPSAKENAGSLGSATASTYVPEFANAAVALEPGETSRPVQTQFGWHVIRLVDKEVTSFEDVRQRLVDEQSGAAFQEWMRDQLRDGDVVVNPRYGRLDIDTLSVQPIRSTELDGGADASATPSPIATP